MIAAIQHDILFAWGIDIKDQMFFMIVLAARRVGIYSGSRFSSGMQTWYFIIAKSLSPYFDRWTCLTFVRILVGTYWWLVKAVRAKWARNGFIWAWAITSIRGFTRVVCSVNINPFAWWGWVVLAFYRNQSILSQKKKFKKGFWENSTKSYWVTNYYSHVYHVKGALSINELANT